MPQQPKTFRVFVSSTFSDMKEERRILQKDVFPQLEKFCETQGAKFQAVDLRWGVNEESSISHRTLEICLNELARCQKLSPKPNFIILMGDKYGWQPAPSKIPENEMKQIHLKLGEHDRNLIDVWYKLDENALPYNNSENPEKAKVHEYVLKPRESKLKENKHLEKKEYEALQKEEYNEWIKKENEILMALRSAILNLNFSDEQKVKYLNSATHQEILKGAVNHPDDGGKPEEHVLVFIRNIEGLPKDKSAKGFIDLDFNEKQDEYCARQNLDLKEKLKTRFEIEYKYGKHCVPLKAKWNNGKSVLEDPKDFANNAYGFLESIIKDQLQNKESIDEIKHEAKLHEQFKERLTKHFRGRDEIIDKIQQYIHNLSEKKVLSLIGDSGSGKSSVMAQVIKLNEKSNAVMVYRFIGTTSASTNIISLLRSVCGQIANAYNVTIESLAGEGREKSLFDMNGLTDVFRKCLALGSAEKPVIIFLDALDQLSDSDNAKSLYWLPKELPEHAQLIVSALTELKGQLPETHIELPVLPENEARIILDQWFDSINRKLRDSQYEFVIDKFKKTKSKSPLYLRLAYEKAKFWHSFEKDLTLSEDESGIINDFIKQLEIEHKEEFVRNSICYMLCGKYQGLTEVEILEILAFDEEYWKIFLDNSHSDHRDELKEQKEELKGAMKIPIAVWSRLYSELEPYLTERDADGVPIITFFHKQFISVLRKRYDLVEENEKS